MAPASARVFAAAMTRIGAVNADADDLPHVQRWAGLLSGRGACRHPDGAATMVRSALLAFAGEFSLHTRERRCSAAIARSDAA